MNEVVLSVPGVSCAHCQVSIEGALTPIEGVEAASVDIEGRTVSVRYSDSVDLGDVIAAIEDVGYDVAR